MRIGKDFGVADTEPHPSLRFERATLGRTTVEPGASPATTFAYNAAGGLISLTDPVGNMTSWTYENLLRPTSETNALGATRSWVYDAVGNVTKATDRNGRVREFTFDGLNRVTQELWKDGSTTVNTISAAFDAASQLTSTSDRSSALALSYDNLGRVTGIDNNGTPNVPRVVLTNSFDAASRRTALSATINGTTDFANAYQYDNLGRMTQVTQQGQSGGNTVADKRADLTYNSNGQFSTLSRYADLAATQLVATTTYGFDQSNRLTSLTHAKGSTTLAAYSWTFDANSRITAATTPDGTVSYSYDNTGQLIGADHSAQADETYSYDANGNRLLSTLDSQLSTYSTGTNNRLLSDGTYNYEYDAEGNRTRRTSIATGDYVDYAWDHRNRLTAVTYKTSAGVTTKRVEYTYDTLNRRISKSVDDNGNGTIDRAEFFVYDSSGKPDPATGVPLDDIVLVFVDPDGSGPQPSTLNHRLLHGPAIDQVFATESSTNEVLWSLTDHQGTIRDWAEYNSGTNATTIVNHFRYDSFGRRIAIQDGSGNAVPLDSQLSSLDYSYTGREWNADAALYYYRARWYDPAVGRFISEDPIGFGGGDSNLCRIVYNRVLTDIDPSGLVDGPILLPFPGPAPTPTLPPWPWPPGAPTTLPFPSPPPPLPPGAVIVGNTIIVDGVAVICVHVYAIASYNQQTVALNQQKVNMATALNYSQGMSYTQAQVAAQQELQAYNQSTQGTNTYWQNFVNTYGSWSGFWSTVTGNP